jgi:replicative DNA helicase
MRTGDFSPAWTPSVSAVRDVIDFMEASDFMVVAARPGDGKSSYLRYEARANVHRGNSTVIFNLENDPVEYARYMIALDTQIDSRKLRDPRNLRPSELERVRAAARHIATLPLQIVTMGSPTVAEIVRVARKMVKENNIKLMIVDYIQLVRNGIDSRVEDVSITTAALRAFALNQSVPVIAASQLNRSIETRNNENADPMLSDLRDSGSVEQDATIVGFIRPLWKSPEEQQLSLFHENMDHQGHLLPRPKVIPVRMFVAKNRNGEAGVTEPIKWNKATGNYEPIARGTIS